MVARVLLQVLVLALQDGLVQIVRILFVCLHVLLTRLAMHQIHVSKYVTQYALKVHVILLPQLVYATLDGTALRAIMLCAKIFALMEVLVWHQMCVNAHHFMKDLYVKFPNVRILIVCTEDDVAHQIFAPVYLAGHQNQIVLLLCAQTQFAMLLQIIAPLSMDA
jgi:hypothetical protein